MEFNHDEYKQSLLKILDIARESHWYLLDRVTVRQFDIAKTYLWVSSVIGAIAMFMVKETELIRPSSISLTLSIFFASISFLLSILILWGKLWKTDDALSGPMFLATFSYEQLIKNEVPSTVYAGIIKSIDGANETNRATNAKRATILRIAAPFLILSFLSMMTSILIVVFYVR